MSAAPPTIVVTGISGNLGARLLPALSGFRVVGVDFRPNSQIAGKLHDFKNLDVGEESSCEALVGILGENKACAVVHLAFVIDPVGTGVLDVDRMWRINVAGTARVMEAIAQTNRLGGRVEKFIFPSSVSAYGPNLRLPVTEEHPLAGHTLPYAIHKRESDEIVRARAREMGPCRIYLLRPHIFTGTSMRNYLVGTLRGTPSGKGRLAKYLLKKNKRLPLLLPMGRKYLENKLQFVHVDDVARLIAYILRREENDPPITILNVAGRGKPLTVSNCATIAQAKVVRLPGRALCRAVLRLMWAMGISGVPPEAFPYLTGSYTMNTSRLQQFLGKQYEDVIRYEIREALADSFAPYAVHSRAAAMENSAIAS